MAALAWYVAVQFLGLLAYLSIGPYARHLPAAGYTFSKTLGVFTLGYLLWIGTSLGVLRNEPGGVLLVLLGFLVLAAAAVHRNRGRGAMPPLHVVASTELVFLVTFVTWALVRFAAPAVRHTEQPMDLMMLTAVSASPTFPPADPWLSGYPISYYYLGYWMLSAIGLLAGTPPAVSYNLGQACWFALLTTTVFGIGYSLTSSVVADHRIRRSITAGLLTAVLVAIASNLWLPVQWGRAWMRGLAASPMATDWWWWQSSRVVNDAALDGRPIEIITEFPFFSFVLGDNHPHLLALPFLALTIALAFSVYVSLMANRRRPAIVFGALLVATCAASLPMNSWNVVAALAMLAAISPLVALSDGSLIAARTWLRLGLLALLAMALVSVPYLLTAQSQLEGFLPNLFHPTELSQFLMMFGTLLPGVVLLLATVWTAGRPDGRFFARWFLPATILPGVWLCLGAYWAVTSRSGLAWLARTAAGAENPLAAAFDRWMAGWPVLVLLIAGVSVTVALMRSPARAGWVRTPGAMFGLLLALCGFALALIPELVYVHDVFANRMNTVFKFYYQAWLFFGIAAAVGIVVAWTRGGAMRAGAVAALVVLAAGLGYPPATIRSRLLASSDSGTFDALGHLRRERPDEYAAIEWVRSNTRVNDVVVQAPGTSYDASSSLISMTTARPTLLGWEGHERQWRGWSYDVLAADRREALAAIYTPSSERDLQQALSAWSVAFVHVGPAERARYSVSAEHEALWNAVMDLVFDHGTVRIYRRRVE